jgi:hypothetical protein
MSDYIENLFYVCLLKVTDPGLTEVGNVLQIAGLGD